MRARVQTILSLSLLLLSGCAGIYAEAGASMLPAAMFSGGTALATTDPPRGDAVKGGTAFGISVGMDFDFTRKARLALGYQYLHTGLGSGVSTSLNASDARFDLTLANLSDAVKLRGGVGFGVGTGTATMPDAMGGSLSHHGTGGEGLAGIGLTIFARPNLGINLLVGPTYFQQQAALGSLVGFGGFARVGVSYYFGDTRPDVTITQPMWKNNNVMPTIAHAARDVLCQAYETTHDSWAAVVVRCPDDKREIMFLQTSDAVMITCEHSTKDDCQARVRQFIDASQNHLK